MTSENSDQQQNSNQDEISVPPDKKKNPFIKFILIIISVTVFAVVLGHNYLSIQELKKQTTGSQLISSLITDFENASRDIKALNTRTQTIEIELASLSTSLAQSNQSLETLYSNLNNQDRRLSVSEVEHLVKIANLKLALEGNTDAAIIALDEANNRLAELGHPALFPVRRQITADINNIKSMPQLDIAGMSFSLSDLASRVEQFSLKASSVAGSVESSTSVDPVLPAWKRLLLGVWLEFKSMFIVTRTDQGMPTSLLPNETFFLYQNLRLQIESARLAVLRGDTILLQDSLVLAASWLDQYFDSNSAAVVNAINELNKMKDVDLEKQAPNLDASLDAINKYIEENKTSNIPDTTSEQL